jgi:uncharacterized membrane protein
MREDTARMAENPVGGSFLPGAVATAALAVAAAVAEIAGESIELAAAFAVEAGERAVAAAVAGLADCGNGDSSGDQSEKDADDQMAAFEYAWRVHFVARLVRSVFWTGLLRSSPSPHSRS